LAEVEYSSSCALVRSSCANTPLKSGLE
jgi:hypothetical protein